MTQLLAPASGSRGTQTAVFQRRSPKAEQLIRSKVTNGPMDIGCVQKLRDSLGEERFARVIQLIGRKVAEFYSRTPGYGDIKPVAILVIASQLDDERP